MLKLNGIKCEGIVAHVGKCEDRKNLINYTLDRQFFVFVNDIRLFRFGRLDILVSNAAVNPHYGDMMSVSNDQWEKLLSINVNI